MRTSPFDLYFEDYDQWFEKHEKVYHKELEFLKEVFSTLDVKNSVEIGVGSGRFALPLNIKLGVDPSFNMLKLAKKRGITCIQGKVESLPFSNEAFDLVLMITVLCFLKDPFRAFFEIHRILKENGNFVLVFLNKNSTLVKKYQEKPGRFFQTARFYALNEINLLLNKKFKLITHRSLSLSEDGSGSKEDDFVLVLYQKI